MTLAAFNGQEALTFPDYINLETGKTLHAEPGGVYDVAPASGRPVAEVPEPWFTPARFATGGLVADKGAPAEGDDAPGTSSDDEPETEVSREF